MSTTDIILIVCLGVAVLGIAVYIILKGIKNKWFSQLNDCIKQAIKEAEESGKSGPEKKAYVLAKVEAKCKELGIPYKPLMQLISKLIDEIVEHYNCISK